MSESIANFMTDDHHRADRLLAGCEQALSESDWGTLAVMAPQLCEALLGHFDLEEQSLFPALLAASPMAQGPTRVMTMEHAQMRALIAEFEEAIGQRDRPSALGLLETLHFLIQQHNAKEEGILYPLADLSLAGQEQEILSRLGAS